MILGQGGVGFGQHQQIGVDHLHLAGHVRDHLLRRGQPVLRGAGGGHHLVQMAFLGGDLVGLAGQQGGNHPGPGGDHHHDTHDDQLALAGKDELLRAPIGTADEHLPFRKHPG
jgi:hypothetical protein